MEMFLLMGDDYVKDASIGPECFRKVVKMESTIMETQPELLSTFYSALYKAGIGRSIILYLEKTEETILG